MVQINKWAQENPEAWNEIQRRRSRERRFLLREEIIKLLGGKCCRCGFTDHRALQIDHAIRGLHGHVYERKSKGCEMYMKEVLSLIKDGSKEFQLLCANCNWIKRSENNEIRPRLPTYKRIPKENLFKPQPKPEVPAGSAPLNSAQYPI